MNMMNYYISIIIILLYCYNVYSYNDYIDNIDNIDNNNNNKLSDLIETDLWLGERDCPIKCNAACECKNKKHKLCTNMCPQCLLQGIPCGLKINKQLNNMKKKKKNKQQMKKKIKHKLPNHINLMEVSSITSKHKKLKKVKKSKKSMNLVNNQHLPYKTKIAHQTVPISKPQHTIPPPPPSQSAPPSITKNIPNKSTANVKHLMDLQNEIISEVQKLHPEITKNDQGLSAMMEVLNTYNPPPHHLPHKQHALKKDKSSLLTRSLDRRLKRIEERMDKIASQQAVMSPSSFASSLPFKPPSMNNNNMLQPCCEGMNSVPPLPPALSSNPFLQQLHKNLGTHRALVYQAQGQAQGQLLPQIHPARINIYDGLVGDLQRLVNWIQARRAANLPPSPAIQTIKSLLDQALVYSTQSN